MIKLKFVFLLLVFMSCRNIKTITKSLYNHTATEKKDSSAVVKKDSVAVHIDTSLYDAEYSLELAPDTGVTYISAGGFLTTRHIIKATIKTKGQLFKIDSVAVHSIDSGKIVSKKFDKVTESNYDKVTKKLSWYWYILLIAVLVYYAYRTAKRYKLF